MVLSQEQQGDLGNHSPQITLIEVAVSSLLMFFRLASITVTSPKATHPHTNKVSEWRQQTHQEEMFQEEEEADIKEPWGDNRDLILLTPK